MDMVKDPLGAVDALFAAHWEPVAGNDADWGVSEALEHALLAIAPAQVRDIYPYEFVVIPGVDR